MILRHIFCILGLLFESYAFSQAPSSSQSPQEIPATNAFNYEANVVFDAFSFPISAVTDSFSSNMLSAIQTNGQACGFGAGEIELMQKAYLYLIFLTKLNAVQTNTAYAAYLSDFSTYTQDNGSSLPHIPSQTLVTSAGWSGVEITNEDIINSPAWQLYCQAAVVDTFQNLFNMLNIAHYIEIQVFNYIPHIETCYYDNDYTSMRTTNEIVRLKMLLELHKQKQYASLVPGWSTLSPSDLSTQASLFQNSDFYTNTHNVYTFLNTKAASNNELTTTQLSNPQKLASPLKEQVWAYFMLREVSLLLYGLTTPTTLQNMLTNIPNIQPTLFPFTIEDYPYFSELLAVTCKAQNNASGSIYPSPQTYDMTSSLVSIAFANQPSQTTSSPQNFWDDLEHIGDDIVGGIKTAVSAVVGSINGTAANVINSGIDSTVSAMENAGLAAYDGIKGVGQGIIGLGANIIGNIAQSSTITDFGQEWSSQAFNDLQSSATNLESSINNLGNAVESVPDTINDMTGQLVGIIADDKVLGENISAISNSIVNAEIDITSKVAQLIAAKTVTLYTSLFEIQQSLVSLISATAFDLIAGGNTSELSSEAISILKMTVHSIVGSFNNLLNLSKATLSATMIGLGNVINAMTTTFIDISREIVFVATLTADSLAAGITGGNPLAEAEQTRDNVTSVLNAHRQTINQVMGVAVAIGFTVVSVAGTGGAAAAVDAEADAAIISASETVSVTAGGADPITVTAITGDTEVTAADTAAEAGTETGGETTGEGGSSGGDSGDNGDDNDNDDDNSNEKKNEQSQGKSPTESAVSIAINGLFGAFNIISGLNADGLAQVQEQSQIQQLYNSWQMINTTKAAIFETQKAYLEELQIKQQAALSNMQLGFTYVKNYLNNTVNTYTQSIQKAVSPLIAAQLAPQSSLGGLLAGDIGSTWGVQTPYLNLYPSQGFNSTMIGRTTFPFAQEIAETPFTSDESNPTSGTPSNPKLWFNQKVFALDETDSNGTAKNPTDPLEVSISFQIIKIVNDAAYMGLYLGGNYYDYRSASYLSELTANNNYDIDTAHLAKMVVIYRNSATDALQLGIYEYEGLGWIATVPLPNMNLGEVATYTLDAQLNDTSLTVTLTSDNDTSTSISDTYTVSALQNQRTYGVIASGAAIQWNQSTPTVATEINRTARPTISITPEITREKNSMITAARNTNPTFGSMIFKPLNAQSILFSEYVYTTTNTPIAQQTGNQTTTDYIVFAENNNGTLAQLGAAPSSLSSNNMVIVSLISGNAYNQQGTIVASSSTCYTTYVTHYGALNTTTNTAIMNAQAQMLQQLKSVTFGPFSLQAMDISALEQQQFIYTCSQTLVDPTTNNAITDYLLLVEIVDNNELGSIVNLSPLSSQADGLLSIISGNLYNKSTTIQTGTAPNPIATGYPGLQILEKAIPTLEASLVTEIQTAQSTYAQEQAAASSPQPINPSTSSGNIISLPTNNQSGPTISIGPAQNSLASTQNAAAQPNGLQINLGNI